MSGHGIGNMMADHRWLVVLCVLLSEMCSGREFCNFVHLSIVCDWKSIGFCFLLSLWNWPALCTSSLAFYFLHRGIKETCDFFENKASLSFSEVISLLLSCSEMMLMFMPLYLAFFKLKVKTKDADKPLNHTSVSLIQWQFSVNSCSSCWSTLMKLNDTVTLRLHRRIVQKCNMYLSR